MALGSYLFVFLFSFFFPRALLPALEVQVRFELAAELYLRLSTFKLSCGPLGYLGAKPEYPIFCVLAKNSASL